MRGRYCLRPLTWPVEVGQVGPQAAVDGVKWPLEHKAHQWRSDPAEPLPQWLEVDFARPVTLNTVYLTFDTNISGRFPTAKQGAEITAQDYRLLYRAADAWKPAFEEKGNWRRFRRHRFPPVTTDRIRLEILKARGGSQARLYEIRAYHEE